MRKRKKGVYMLSLLMILCMVLCACGKESPVSNESENGNGPAETTANPESNTAESQDTAELGESKKFAHISLEVSFSACQLMIKGMEDELRDTDTLELYNYELDDNKFMDQMDQIVSMDYDGVIIYAKDGDLGTQAAEMCRTAELPAVAIDIAVTDPEPLVGYSFGSDYGLGYNAAVALAEGIYEKKGSYDCNILIVCRDTDTVGAERLRGFQDGIKEHEEMKVVYNIMEEWSTDATLAPIENVLNSHPEIDAFWGPNAGVTTAGIQIMDEKGITDDIVVVSGECSLWVKEQIEAGKVYAGIDSLPYDMGAKCMEMLYGYLDGTEFDPNQNLESKIIKKDNINDSTTWINEKALEN